LDSDPRYAKVNSSLYDISAENQYSRVTKQENANQNCTYHSYKVMRNNSRDLGRTLLPKALWIWL